MGIQFGASPFLLLTVGLSCCLAQETAHLVRHMIYKEANTCHLQDKHLGFKLLFSVDLVEYLTNLVKKTGK